MSVEAIDANERFENCRAAELATDDRRFIAIVLDEVVVKLRTVKHKIAELKFALEFLFEISGERFRPRHIVSSTIW